jgi:P-type E1-E2 ATPase
VAVYRGDKGTKTMDGEQLVVGDVVIIRNGARIPADCILISSDELFIDESDFTGEKDDEMKEALSENNYK